MGCSEGCDSQRRSRCFAYDSVDWSAVGIIAGRGESVHGGLTLEVALGCVSDQKQKMQCTLDTAQ